MSTYNAGEVRATADLNRDPFIEGLRSCISEGRAFARMDFTASAHVNTGEARRELARLEIMLRRISEESVDIDVSVHGATAAKVEIQRLKTEAAAYRAEMERSKIAQEAYRAEQERSRVAQQYARREYVLARTDLASLNAEQRKAAAVQRQVKSSTEDSTKEFGLMRHAIEQLGPPLIPIAGGLLAASSAAVGFGTAAIFAFKGAQSEIKAATPLGQRFSGVLRTLKDDAAELSHTAAGGVLPGFEEAMLKANRYVPQFNVDLAGSAKVLGDVAQHLVGGLIGGLHTFNPLIVQAEQGADRLAARFEAWSTGPGGARFAATLSQDLEHLGPALGNIATMVEHLVAAFHPVGLGMLDSLSALSSAISHIPVGVLQAGATAYIAYRTAVLASAGFNAVIGLLERLTVAQTAAAVSSTRLAAAQAAGAGEWGAATLYGRAAGVGAVSRTAGALATATRAVVPYALAWVGATVAINAAANATEKWQRSTSTVKSMLANSLDFTRTVLTGHPVDAFNNLRANANAGATAAGDQRRGQAAIDNVYGNKSSMLATFQETAAAKAAAAAQATRIQTMGKLRAVMDASVLTVNNLRNAEVTLREQGLMRNNAALAANEVAMQGARDAGFAAGEQYHKLAEASKLYTEELKTQARVRRELITEQNAVRDRYANSQADLLGGMQRNTFAQNPGLTAGITSLQAYQKTVAAAVTAEEKWTKVTDDHTVKIRGQKVETDRWNLAVAQANGNVSAAVGIILGHRKALADDQLAADGAAAMQARLSSAVGATENAYQLSDQQLNMYASLIGVTSEDLATGAVSQDQFTAAIGRVKGVIDSANTSTAGWVAALAQFTSGADTAASRGQLLAAAMVSLNGPALAYGAVGSSVAAANQQFVDAFNKADKSVVNLKTGFIDFHNAGAAPLFQSLQALQTQAAQFAAVTYQNEVSTRGRTQASKDAAAVYYNDTHRALESEASQLHITKKEADALADRYFHWPKNAATRIEAMGVEGTNRLLEGIGEQLALLTHHPWIATLNGDPKPAMSAADKAQARINAIRQNKVPGLNVHSNAAQAEIERLQRLIDSLHGKEINLNVNTLNTITTNRRSISGPSGSAAGNLWRAFAEGGHMPEIARTKPNTVRVWAEPETQGEAYIPLANDWRRPRAREIAQNTVRMLGGHAEFEQGGFSHVTGSGGGSTSSHHPVKQSTGGKTNPANKTEQGWFFYDGLYYQGRQALNEAIAAHSAGTGGGGSIGAYGSGKTRGYGYGGQGYGSYQEAYNARTEAARSNLTPMAADARAEVSLLSTAYRIKKMGKDTADAIRTAVAKMTETITGAATSHIIPNSLLARYTKDNADLNKEIDIRDKLTKKIEDLNTKLQASQQKLASDTASLKQYGDALGSSLLTSFNLLSPASQGPASPGATAASFTGNLATAVAQAQRAADDIKAARAAGMAPELLQVFEQAGTAGLDALEGILSSGPQAIADDNAQYAKLLSLTQGFGADSQQDNVDLNKQIADDNTEIKDYSSQIAANTKLAAQAQTKIDKDLADLRDEVRKIAPAIAANLRDLIRNK